MKDLVSLSKKIKALTIILDKLKEEKTKLEVSTLLEQQMSENLQKLINSSKLSDDLFLTAKQVIVKYNISRSTLERAIRSGLKFTSKREGTNRLFKKIDLDNYFYRTNKK